MFSNKNIKMASTTQESNKEVGVFKEANFNRYGLISAILLIVGCLGGITVGLGAINDTVALIAVVISTMTTLSLLLAIAPMKYIINAGIIAVSIDVILIIYYTLIA